MLELETRLEAIVMKAQELVQALEAIRHDAITVGSERDSSQVAERMLLHMIAEEEEGMRLVARHLAALHYMVSSQPKQTK